METVHSTPLLCVMNKGSPIVLTFKNVNDDLATHGPLSSWFDGGKLDVNFLLSRVRLSGGLERPFSPTLSANLEEQIRKLRGTRKKLNIKTSRGVYERDAVIVITRPFYDFATWYTHAWAKSIVEEAKKKFGIIDLSGNLAIRNNLEYVLTEFKPALYFHYGHGNEHSILGQYGEKIIDEDNVDLLKGCQSNVLACYTALGLGPLAIESGCIVYSGYSGTFVFMTEYHVLERADEVRNRHELSRLIRRTMVQALKHDRDALRLLGDDKAQLAGTLAP